MIKTLFISSSSACFEWENEIPYYTEAEYTMYLDGEAVLTSNTNVFSLFGLSPDTEYKLTSTAGTETITFRTKKDSFTVSVRDFGAAGDGTTDDTQAIQSAINCLPRGAKLVFPTGTYLTAPVFSTKYPEKVFRFFKLPVEFDHSSVRRGGESEIGIV
jgi:polygalacturonase